MAPNSTQHRGEGRGERGQVTGDRGQNRVCRLMQVRRNETNDTKAFSIVSLPNDDYVNEFFIFLFTFNVAGLLQNSAAQKPPPQGNNLLMSIRFDGRKAITVYQVSFYRIIN